MTIATKIPTPVDKVGVRLPFAAQSGRFRNFAAASRVEDGGDTLAVGRLRGGRQCLELGRFAPVVQKILNRGTLSDSNLLRQFASAARRLDFRSSFVGKIGGLLKVEPCPDRAALFIVGRMAQVGVDKAECPGVSAMRMSASRH